MTPLHLVNQIMENYEAAKLLLGDSYREKIKEPMAIISSAMQKHGCNELQAILNINKEQAMTGSTVMLFSAAAVELMCNKSKPEQNQ